MKVWIHCLYFLIAFTTYFTARYIHLRTGHVQVCQDLKNKFVEPLSETEYQTCVGLFDQVLTFDEWEITMNSWLGRWGWSHLMVYAPQESEEIWESRSVSNGVRLKLIDTKYLVYEAHPHSAFEKGDVVLFVNGQADFDSDDINYGKGNFLVKRGDKKINIDVSPQEYQWDDGVKISSPYFKVPSFRGEFFEEKSMKAFSKKLKQINTDTLYIDLRGNLGGNIVSGLRFLSFFLCDQQRIGTFVLPAHKDKGENVYPNDLYHEGQLKIVDNHHKVHLDVPESSYCYQGDVEVLVDSSTSSTSEMVTLALREFRKTKIRGQLTSGRMVLSSWEQVRNFPDGYLYSFPYAIYESSTGAIIEGAGIVPDIEKSFILSLERRGKDSFIN